MQFWDYIFVQTDRYHAIYSLGCRIKLFHRSLMFSTPLISNFAIFFTYNLQVIPMNSYDVLGSCLKIGFLLFWTKGGF